jgi:lipopolysaccharide export system permease protein
MLLDRYIGGLTLRAFLIISVGLTALFSLLTFVEQLSYVGRGNYRLTDALIYVLLTAPYRLLQLTPVSMLLSTLLALGTLGRASELLVAQFIVPPAQQLAQRQQAAALNDAVPLLSAGGFWAENNRQYLNVQDFGYGNTMEGIEIYSFGDDGTLHSYIHADRADIEPDGTWLLTGVLRKQIVSSQFITQTFASLGWNSFISGREVQLLTLPPETMPPVALYEYIQGLKQLHQQAIRYEQKFWTMVSIPLSILAMVLIAAPFVFGTQRSQGAGRQLFIGTILGVVFLLSQQITGYLGLLLDLNPAVSALAPTLLLLGLGAYLLQRQHDTLARPSHFPQFLEKLPIARALFGKQSDEDEAEPGDLKHEIK